MMNSEYKTLVLMMKEKRKENRSLDSIANQVKRRINKYFRGGLFYTVDKNEIY